MKIATVLLRWYKSFNVNYMGYPEDRNADVVQRPWNKLGTSQFASDEYHFIEISLEKDITTIVGGNESGKSHLLSAISKVLTGKGIADGFSDDGSPFSRTDLCHYTAQRSINAIDWPNIGVVFNHLTLDEIEKITQSAGTTIPSSKNSTIDRFAVVLAPDGKDIQAYLYFDGSQSISLDAEKLSAVRSCLPRVEFIHSNLAIEDQFCINALIKAYKNEDTTTETMYGFAAANEMMSFLDGIKFPTPQSPNIFHKINTNSFLLISQQLSLKN
ncbi:hypothetical protein FACS189427_08630 [Planctomycetales bacterium]|nr:hypothetical protein FACS189427_08630 [Planctomycetales bacterium]